MIKHAEPGTGSTPEDNVRIEKAIAKRKRQGENRAKQNAAAVPKK